MHDEWLARWRSGEIGFHAARPNPLLERHVTRLAGGARVLVPLCGKSEDLALLAARGHEVVGVELAELAVAAFFAEHALTPEVSPRGPFRAYRAGPITLLVGDVFDATPQWLGPVDALYDRAALVALPTELRPRYVAALRGLVPVGASALVITLDYDQARAEGPPFSVDEAELRSHYAGSTIELVEARPTTDVSRLTRAGVPVTERCFAIVCGEPRP
jgi:thiopurine S-methyltransferase